MYLKSRTIAYNLELGNCIWQIIYRDKIYYKKRKVNNIYISHTAYKVQSFGARCEVVDSFD